MSPNSRHSQLALTAGFLILIFGVPIGQVVIELYRGERVQYTDLFRLAPTEKNLRRFETTLEETSWIRYRLRPALQRLLFAALRDTGSMGLRGRQGWLFYRPGVRYLAEPDAPQVYQEDTRWIRPVSLPTRREDVVTVIAGFHDRLLKRGIQLLVLPTPGKASVYPDRLTRRAEGEVKNFRSPTLRLLADLEGLGIATVDLFSLFQSARALEPRADGTALYLAKDTHWTPAGAQLAAEAVARKLKDLNWVPPAEREFAARRLRVLRRGDILEMMQISGIGNWYPGEIVECLQIRDAVLGLMVPAAGSRSGTYIDAWNPATVLLLGDSYSRIFQLPEPRSLGELLEPDEPQASGASTRRLLPGSAGFPSHLALALGTPVDYIVSDGGASTDVRKKLAVNPEILENKRVVVWQFAERDIGLGRLGWEDVPLPP